MKRIICFLLAGIMLLSLCACQSSDYKKAKELLDQKKFDEAKAAFLKIKDYKDSAELAKECDFQKASGLLDNEEYTDAIRILESLGSYGKSKTTLKNTYKALSEEIYELMEDGDYIEAQALLDSYDFLPDRDEIQEKIIYESFALTCLMNLKPRYKNPNSLQANSIEFHESSNPYPLVVIHESGQNGFGGYSTSYSLYTDKDLSIIGTCSSLDKDDYDASDLDDLAELLICITINGMTNELIDADFDLGRINRILSNALTPKLNIKQYENVANKVI